MDTNNSVPHKGRTRSSYENALYLRRGQAAEHERAMVAKYSAILGYRDAEDYHNWSEQRVSVGSDGQSRSYTHRDYPLPYNSERYFRRFVELFLSRSAEQRFPDSLSQQFIGDKVDADYIEGLFITAEIAGLFTEGAALVFHGDADYSRYPPAGPSEYQDFNGAPSYNVFFGGRANEMRRDAIRRWLVRRAEEIDKNLESTAAAISDAPTPTYLPNEDEIKIFLTGDKSIARCDAAASRIGLTIGNTSKKKAKPRQIDALAFALVDSHKASGNEGAFRVALAKRYGVDYSKGYERNHTPDGSRTNKTWAKEAKDAMEAAGRWVPPSPATKQ
jgi:hypothetical protein